MKPQYPNPIKYNFKFSSNFIGYLDRFNFNFSRFFIFQLGSEKKHETNKKLNLFQYNICVGNELSQNKTHSYTKNNVKLEQLD